MSASTALPDSSPSRNLLPMTITKELIEATIKQIEQERESHIANANVCIGKIAAMRSLIEHMDKPEPVTVEPNP